MDRMRLLVQLIIEESDTGRLLQLVWILSTLLSFEVPPRDSVYRMISHCLPKLAALLDCNHPKMVKHLVKCFNNLTFGPSTVKDTVVSCGIPERLVNSMTSLAYSVNTT
jgi:hypothetical protein